MNNKIPLDQSNPFTETECVVNSIEDINRISTKVEFKSENGIIVTLPDGDSSLLFNSNSEELSLFETGDAIDIYIDSEGNVYKANEKYEIYKNILSKAKNGHIFNGKVIDATNQGLLVSIDGLQSFMPEGQIGLDKSDDLQSYKGKDIEVKLISVKLKEREGNRFLPIVSHKVLIDEKNDAFAREKLSTLKIGDIVTGKVKRIASYGVFVTLFPSVDGLIHITDLSWERVSNPAEVVYIGQSIEVIILEMERKNGDDFRISLGLKQLSQKPWERFDKNSKAGDIVSGTISKIVDYGIFVKLPCGVEGLVHRTELSWDRTVTPKSFQKGDTVTSTIINIDWKQEKLLLSIKQMQRDPWTTIDNQIAIGDIMDTTINNITNFGLFVKINDGLDGFIHISELSWTEKIKKLKKQFSVGDCIKATILNIDKENRKIELSHKRIIPDPLEKYSVGQHVKAIVVDTITKGILMKLELDDLPAFIPAESISNGITFNVDTKLDCIINEIDKDKRTIIVTIE